jgi:histone H3/H4
MAEQLVTVTQVKEVIGGAEMRTDGTLPDGLNGKVLDLLNGAINRTKENGRSTVRPEDLAGRPADSPASLTVASRVRDVLKNANMRTDSNLTDAVNAHVQTMLEEGIQRAKANGRSTVRPYDLPTVR